MNIGQVFLEALDSISANKMRAGLTILGIVIGVAAVIAMVSIGQGAQNTITDTVNSIGSNLLFVQSGNQNVDNLRNVKPLTTGDAAALADGIQAPSVRAVAAVVSGRATVSYGGEQKSTSMMGVTPAYEKVRNTSVGEGQFITDQDQLGRKSVVLLGIDVAQKLFGRTTGLVGETVRVNGQPMRVQGVLEAKGGSSFGSQDDQILVPLSTAMSRLLTNNGNEVHTIFVEASSQETINSAMEEVKQVLRMRHRTQIGADDFTVTSQEELSSTVSSITNVFTIFLGGVAAISLLVGGIGIMNIMLVSVTERTREIGLRKALGARKRDILVQFMTESAVLSLLGGVIGILLGWLLAVIIGWIAKSLNANITPSVTLGVVLLATVFSSAVGLFFGIYPASRAAALQPVEALRSN